MGCPSRQKLTFKQPVLGAVHTQMLEQHNWVGTSLVQPSCWSNVMIARCNCSEFVIGACSTSMLFQRWSGAASKLARIALNMLSVDSPLQRLHGSAIASTEGRQMAGPQAQKSSDSTCLKCRISYRPANMQDAQGLVIRPLSSVPWMLQCASGE